MAVKRSLPGLPGGNNGLNFNEWKSTDLNPLSTKEQNDAAAAKLAAMKKQTAVSAPSSAAVSGGSSGGDGGASAYAAYLQQIESAQAAQEARYQEQLRQQQALRDQAANVAKANQQQTYDASVSKLNSEAENNLRDNWVSMMEDNRKLPQILAAQGATGGMSESTARDLYNNYLNGQNSVQKSKQENLAALAKNMADNNAAIEQQRLTGQAGDLSTYQANLNNAYSSYLNAKLNVAQAQASAAASAAKKSTASTGNTSGTSNTKALSAYQTAYNNAIASGRSEDDADNVAQQAYQKYMYQLYWYS